MKQLGKELLLTYLQKKVIIEIKIKIIQRTYTYGHMSSERRLEMYMTLMKLSNTKQQINMKNMTTQSKLNNQKN